MRLHPRRGRRPGATLSEDSIHPLLPPHSSCVCVVCCVGAQTLSLLQGPLTEPGLLQHVEQQTAAHQATAVMLTNYTKVGLGAIYRHDTLGSHLFYGCTAGQAHVPESLAGGAVVRQPRPGPTPSSPFLLPGVFCF